MKKTLLSIVGPTAIGKTAMAITLAQHFDTDILSSDSRQFYKEMQIGTAVPSKEELASAKHHFVQHKSILDTYSVGDFERDALQLLDKLFETKNIVILVGGSGLYNDAVTRGLDKFPKIAPKIRESLNRGHIENGISSLQQQLKTLDPVYYDKVDKQNPHRLIRALEVCIGTGKPYSFFLSQDKDKPLRTFTTITVGISAERPLIYDRINARVDQMIADGLLAEVEKLVEYRHLNALRTVGYKELFQYLDGTCAMDDAISEIKKNTRRFAKRQMTWFNKNKDTFWVPFDMPRDILISSIEENIIKL